MRAFKLRSPALGPGGEIPPKYTCDGSESHPRFAGPSRPRAPQGLPSSRPTRRRDRCLGPLGPLWSPRQRPRAP